MPRIRSVHPDLHRDKTLALCSASAERTFVRLWCHLDDEGRGEDDLDLLKADLYPRHRDMDTDAIDRDLGELERLGLVIRYEHQGTRYLSCKPETWARYQRPQKKQDSLLPPPPETPTRPLQDRSDTPTRPVAPVVGGEGSRRGAHTGSGDTGTGTGSTSSRKRSDRATRLPDDWQPEPEPELVAAIGGVVRARHEYAKFADYWRAKPGKDGRKADWQATWRNWLRNAQKYSTGPPEGSRRPQYGPDGIAKVPL